MNTRDRRAAEDESEMDPTLIDQGLGRELRQEMARETTSPGFGPPAALEPEGDGQETLVWEGALTAEELAPEHAAPATESWEELRAHAPAGARETLPAPSYVAKTGRGIAAEFLEETRAEEHTSALHDGELEEVRPSPQASPAFADPRAWFLGRSFGGYRIVCEVASGGMATVFLARKEGPARVSKYAAVKVVHPHLAFEREFVHMFLDEARIAACLHHPNVCRVLDFGMAEGTYYMAMEYMLGETWSTVRLALADDREGRHMLPVVAAHVMAQACEGLHAAHEAADDEGRQLHIVHRDISPQNIFVAYDGSVRVLDFGIARAADRITSTRDGMLKGRLAYMSPEQMANEPITRAADIWSVGVVLREALEGKRLFRRPSDAETMFAVSSEPFPAWTVDVPERLKAIVERALDRNPLSRYMNAHDMALDLARFVNSELHTVSSSELSAWMQRLFAVQIEQKRALLTLPVPEPQGGPSPNPQPLPTYTRIEPPSGTDQLAETFEPLPSLNTDRPRARRRWLNTPTLVVLGILGAVSGVVAGRLLKKPAAESIGESEPSAELEPPAPIPREPPPPVMAPAPRPTVQEPAMVEAAPLQAPPPVTTPAPPAEPTPEKLEPAPVPAPPPQEVERPSARARRERREEAATRPEPAPSEERAPRERAARERPTRAPVEPTSAPATMGPPGTVLVAFDGGWAEVYFNDKLLGTTPGRFSVPSGKQTLVIRPFGTGKPFRQKADVKPGEVTKLFLSADQLN